MRPPSGANTARPEFWTGFDETDDIPLADLWPPHDNEKRLYPVVNATLNGGHEESGMARTQGSWFTPLFCGSGATPDLGFRETKEYANGIRLGWAMSVSGAAMSPNAGYSTMPGLALLMTLFNLRLASGPETQEKLATRLIAFAALTTLCAPFAAKRLHRPMIRRNMFISPTEAISTT
jgi:hypothetical protein